LLLCAVDSGECEFWDSFSHVMPDAVMPMLGLNKTVYG
jgi:hypothetical protein